MTICSRWFVTIAELRSRCRLRAATLYERRAVLTDVGRFVKTQEKATTSPATDCSTTNHRHETSSLSTVSAPQRFKVPAIFCTRMTRGRSEMGSSCAHEGSKRPTLEMPFDFPKRTRTQRAERLFTSMRAPINRPLQSYSIVAPVQERMCRDCQGTRPARRDRCRCPTRKSYPGVSMMQSGENWCGDDGSRSFDGSWQRRVLAQLQVRALLVGIDRIQS